MDPFATLEQAIQSQDTPSWNIDEDIEAWMAAQAAQAPAQPNPILLTTVQQPFPSITPVAISVAPLGGLFPPPQQAIHRSVVLNHIPVLNPTMRAAPAVVPGLSGLPAATPCLAAPTTAAEGPYPAYMTEAERKEIAAAARAARMLVRREERQRQEERRRKERKNGKDAAAAHAAMLPLPGAVAASAEGAMGVPVIMPAVGTANQMPAELAAASRGGGANRSGLRAIKNRESAAKSRAKRVQQTSALEAQVQALREQNMALRSKVISVASAPPDPHAGAVDGQPLRRTRTTPL